EFLQLVVPAVSSESREYVPLGFVGEDTIVSNRCYVVYNSPIWLLGLLQSKLHMVWLAAIGGKLETRYSYSSGVVYNTFPVPDRNFCSSWFQRFLRKVVNMFLWDLLVRIQLYPIDVMLFIILQFGY